MRTKTLLIFLPLLCLSTLSLAQASNQQIDQTVENFLRRWEVPGAVLGIIKDDRLVYLHSYGYSNTDTREVMLPIHRFRIASLSKPITSTAIMLLAQRGELSLDDRPFAYGGVLAHYMPTQGADPRLRDITIRHLLLHQGGWNRDLSGDLMFMPEQIARWDQSTAPAGAQTVIRYGLTRSLDFSPGTAYAYSNFGYNILGRVIEAVSGRDYETFVHQEVLAPCGIDQMQIGSSTSTLPQEVHYYDPPHTASGPSVFPGQGNVPGPYGTFYLEAMDAHGGWVASVPDMLRFLSRVNGTGQRQDLLLPQNIQLMREPSPVFQWYGLGWSVNIAGTRWHTGSLPGTSAMLAGIHDGMGWCILLNGRPTDPAYFGALDQLVWEAIGGVQFGNIDLFGEY